MATIYNPTSQQVFSDFKDAFSQYIVAPIANFGLGGFIFDIEGESSVTLTADITDHFTEGNFSVQDHIALKPKRIKLDTYVGELVFRNDPDNNTTVQKLARKLTVINSYLPQLTSAAGQLKDAFDTKQSDITFAGVSDTALNIYGLIKNVAPPLPKQQQAYQYFKALFQNKILVSLQTPFEFCSNMAIESIVATQDEESKFISNFSITLKEIRTASTFIVNTKTGQIIDSRANFQNSLLTNKGQTGGIVSDIKSVLGVS